ncbi:MAG: Fe-S cluster assembly ATPase SufC [Parachlamydiales bacterium]|jgi:Fe-S cluster assembly ATP-binding protein
MLKIQDLTVAVEGKKLLEHFSLEVQKGQVHVIMGKNGAGKSTLAKVLAGHPAYRVVSGEIRFLDQLLPDSVEERALKGLFVSFQYPLEIPGLSNFDFLKLALNAKRRFLKKKPLLSSEFEKLYLEKGALAGLKPELLKREMNQGFSGGERKKNELLQMALLEPALAVLDEIDSGLDIDALKEVAGAIQKLKGREMALILITHYQRLLNYLPVDFVHVLEGGRLVKSGGLDLASELEEKGYEAFL